MSAPEPLPGFDKLTPYAGGESEIEGVEKVIKLASNEGAFGPSPKGLEAARKALDGAFRYPDGAYTALRRAIADKHGLPVDRIIMGSGSDDLITLLCRCYATFGDEVLFTEHAFAMYPIYALGVGATLVPTPEADLTANVDALLARANEKTKLLFLANPNNPTGTYLPVDELRRLRAGLPGHVLLVLDAAYAEYVNRNDYEPGAALVHDADNVMMLRTFSKIYGLAGLRVGWGYGPPGVIDVLNRIRSPFNVSVVGQAAALAALNDDGFLAKSVEHNEEWRRWTTESLRAIGLTVPDSVCNFILVRFPDKPGKDAAAADGFLKSKGIIARRMAGYGLPDSLRLSIGREDEMRAAVGALTEFMGK